jgi:CBS domain containing-hemolysin-like protein
MTNSLLVVLVVVLALLTTVISCVLMAITKIARVKAHHLLDQEKSGAATLLKMVEHPLRYQGALALVVATLSAGLTVASVKLFDRLIADGGAAVALVVAALAVYLSVWVVPNALGSRRLEQFGLRLAGPAFVLGKVLYPLGALLVKLFRPKRKKTQEGANGDEADDTSGDGTSEDEESIEEEERELIHSIFEFGDTLVREVMVPRTDMVTIPVEATLADALDTITKAGFSRIPIYEGDHDNIIGVLYAKDLLKRTLRENLETNVRHLGRAPLFEPEQKKVADLLREMQTKRIHMAIVVDEYGGTAGLVTIEDLIEEIVGEIVDEYDQEEPLVQQLSEDSLRVSARLPINDVNELLKVDLPHEEWDTVGGLVFGLIGRVPEHGERVKYDSLEFETERVVGRRIQQVLIRRTADSDDDSSS